MIGEAKGEIYRAWEEKQDSDWFFLKGRMAYIFMYIPELLNKRKGIPYNYALYVVFHLSVLTPLSDNAKE